MAILAQGSRSLISRAVETVWGVTPTGTQGYQVVNVGGAKTSGSASGLDNLATVYSATIDVDGGGAQTIQVIGSEAQTYGAVVTQINQDLVGASIAIVAGNLQVTSDLFGVSSTILIADTDLFSTLTDYASIASAVAGTATAVEMTSVPYTSFSVNLTKDIHEDMSVRADRQERFNIHGNKSVAGSIDCNLSASSFDDLLESACHSTFSANVLKTGTTRKSFTVEQGQQDINQYTVYTGMTVNTLDLNVPVSGIVTASFGLIGRSSSISGAPLDATVTEPTITQPFFHASGVFKEDGAPIAIITSIALKIDNQYVPNFALGDAYAKDLSYGFAKVDGTVVCYFEDDVLINKFINQTGTSLEFELSDGVDTLNFNLPNVEFNSATKTTTGQGSVLVTFVFKALYDGTALSNLVITRS